MEADHWRLVNGRRPRAPITQMLTNGREADARCSAPDTRRLPSFGPGPRAAARIERSTSDQGRRMPTEPGRALFGAREHEADIVGRSAVQRGGQQPVGRFIKLEIP